VDHGERRGVGLDRASCITGLDILGGRFNTTSFNVKPLLLG
jgi:hypothetical protein